MKLSIRTSTTATSTKTLELGSGPTSFELDSSGSLQVEVANNLVETTFSSFGPLDRDLTIEISVEFSAAGPSQVLAPMYQGVMHSHQAAGSDIYEFRGPGWSAPERDDRRLGIPALVLSLSGKMTLIGTDPAFSTHLSFDPATRTAHIRWTYLAAAGAHNEISRRIVIAAVDSVEAALDDWFVLATPDIPAGPAWLHDISWQHYDFMAKNGDGWFDDIDAVCSIVEPESRHRVAFTLHGWYDRVGRYCFDREAGSLDREWTVFPFMNDERLVAREGMEEEGGSQPPAYTLRNLDQYRPLSMNWPEIRRRIAYAKNLGFRVPFYLITGMLDLGSAEEHARNGDGLDVTQTPLWAGPDAIGETYLMNPVHDDVRRFFLELTARILEEVGDLIDALVVDEAYYVGYGQLGPASCPGYADLAQATLVREISELCHKFRPGIAVLTADHMGTQHLERQAYPYSLFADGIYHDAWNHAQAHEAARFPAWRNVVWSCTWAPSSEILNTKWAVLAFDAPISTSNGCFGDDIGVAQMDPRRTGLLSELWGTKLDRTFTKSVFTIATN